MHNIKKYLKNIIKKEGVIRRLQYQILVEKLLIHKILSVINFN